MSEDLDMSERHLVVRSSFVNVGNKRRATHVFVLLFVLLFTFTGLVSCATIKPQAKVDPDNINLSAENVARVYAEAIFSGDDSLMIQCFPSSFSANLTDDDLLKMEKWGLQIKDSLYSTNTVLDGSLVDKTKDYLPDKQSRQYNSMRESIAESVGISPELILDIKLCTVNLLYQVDGEKKYNGASVIVYKADELWYAHGFESMS